MRAATHRAGRAGLAGRRERDSHSSGHAHGGAKAILFWCFRLDRVGSFSNFLLT